MSKAALPVAIFSERNKRRHQQSKIKSERTCHKSASQNRSLNYQPRHLYNNHNSQNKNKRKVESVPKPLLLECSWTFWYDKYIGPGKTPKEYNDALISVGTFNSVQDFWNYHNHIPITLVKETSSFHMMKSGVRPLWEDPANVEGGNLSFRIKKENLLYVWLHLALNVIGEQFSQKIEPKDEICGLTMSMRRTEVVISIWHKNAVLFVMDQFREMIQKAIPKVPIVNENYRIHQANNNFSPRRK
eukprot:TRINITY_DN5462_c0_g1_i1.p1 TRINITY_DN5462_c0_g1~~TRINITY_DN5462_c0_g1_i1.p1  ORF type:complete len:244 (+),score=24.81 TRINITY_DN5462_c0_g1_i1:15-746(+)